MLKSLLDRADHALERGDWDDAIAALGEALTLVPGEGGPAEQADILRRLSKIHRDRGDLDRALDLCEASLEVAVGSGLMDRRVAGVLVLSTIRQQRGELRQAEEACVEAARGAAEIGDERAGAMAEQNLGVLANIRGEVALALEKYRRALGLYERIGERLASAQALNCMGMAHVDLEEWEAADRSFGRAEALADALGDAGLLGAVSINRAELYLKVGDFRRARDRCDQAFEIFGRLGADGGMGEAYKFYGVLHREAGKPVLADTSFRSAVDLARRCQDLLLEAETLMEWAPLYVSQDRNREALASLNAAYRLFATLHAQRELLDIDRRLDALEATYLQVVRAWGESIEGQDRYTAGHCERVANYTCMLAEAVGIKGRELTWIRMGGYLHDVGKIAVPRHVLNKPGKLDAEEWVLMQRHTVEGDAIVAELNFAWDIRPLVRSHHERWDGTGYPDRLKGEEIPLMARILCVADVFDALTTTRSYRPAMSRDEALRIMESESGRIFDPRLCALFAGLITRAAPTHDRRFPVFAPDPIAAD